MGKLRAAVTQLSAVLIKAGHGVGACVVAGQPDLARAVTQGQSFQESASVEGSHVHYFAVSPANSDRARSQQISGTEQRLTDFYFARRQVKNISFIGADDEILRELEQFQIRLMLQPQLVGNELW